MRNEFTDWQMWKDALILMRIPFSFYLMPIFWFAFSNNTHSNPWNVAIVFLVLHFFVYPASNGYNSYYDKDETPIGGVASPPPVNQILLYLSWSFDVIAVAISYWLSGQFAWLILIYILASRAYSHPAVRLKKYPLSGTFTVIFFQGFFTYVSVVVGFGHDIFQALENDSFMCAGISSLFLLGSYPLTQIYQHKEDRLRGDLTLSRLLGIQGTFLFSAINLSLGGAMMLYFFLKNDNHAAALIFAMASAPTALYFARWWLACRHNPHLANHKHTMLMNKISSISLTFAFVLIAVVNHFQIKLNSID